MFNKPINDFGADLRSIQVHAVMAIIAGLLKLQYAYIALMVLAAKDVYMTVIEYKLKQKLRLPDRMTIYIPTTDAIKLSAYIFLGYAGLRLPLIHLALIVSLLSIIPSTFVYVKAVNGEIEVSEFLEEDEEE